MNIGRLNLRAILTVFGSVLLAFSIMAYFDWGAFVALACAVVGLTLVLFGQTRPRQRGRHRWH